MKTEVDVPGEGVCMVMAYTSQNPSFIEMARYSVGVNSEYCRKHRYGFRLYTSGFAMDRHPSWSKLLFVQDAIMDYPWVFWIDTDAIVTNPNIRLRRFIDDKYMLVVGKQNWFDPPWNSVNFGVFLMKNDPDVKTFCSRVWEDISRPGREGWEQDGVRMCIENEPFKSKVKTVCRREFNSVVAHYSLGITAGFNSETEAWHKGDFVAHYGWRRTDTLEAMKVTMAECSK